MKISDGMVEIGAKAIIRHLRDVHACRETTLDECRWPEWASEVRACLEAVLPLWAKQQSKPPRFSMIDPK
jgi:hypothetical protein